MGRVQNSGCMRKNPRTCAHPSLGAAGPSPTAHAHSANDPDFSALCLCVLAGRVPVQSRTFVPDVVHGSSSHVRDSQPPARYDATDSRPLHDITLTHPRPPPTSTALKITVCSPLCLPYVHRDGTCRRRDVPSAPHRERRQRGGQRPAPEGRARRSLRRDFCNGDAKSRRTHAKARPVCARQRDFDIRSCPRHTGPSACNVVGDGVAWETASDGPQVAIFRIR